MPRMTAPQKEEAVRRYLEGESSERIAKDLGFSGPAIRQLLKKRGIERRGPIECHRLFSHNEEAFDAPLSPKASYWVGVMVSDGYVTDDSPDSCSASVNLTTKDKEWVEGFKLFLEAGHKINIKKRPNGRVYYNLSIKSKRLTEALKKLGIGPNKSATVEPPEELVICPHFWRGVIDGDGEVDEGNSCPSINLTGSLHTVSAFARFALGLIPDYEPYIKRTMHRNSTHHIDYHGAGALAILEALYPEGCYAGMQRKVHKAQSLLEKYRGKKFRVLRNREMTHTLPYSYKNGERAVQDFETLCKYDLSTIHESRIGNKGLSIAVEGSLKKTKIGYYAAGYYNERLRLKASFRGGISPQEAWEQKKEKIIQEAVSRKHSSLRNSLLANSRPAFAFPPLICRWIIEHFGWKSMLDPCMGWGDRLVGFLASSADLYVGCDPHVAAHGVYMGINSGYNKGKNCVFHCSAFEDLKLEENCVDGAFTSPPYFDAEHYSDDPGQCDSRYQSKEAWVEGFARPLIASCKKAIRPEGHLVINIADQRDTQYHLCGDIMDIAAEEGLEYRGLFEMQTGSFTRSAEPLLVWRVR